MFKLIAIELMLLLVNFLYELVQQIFRYRFVGVRRVILSNAENDKLYLILVLVNLLYVNWGKK